MSTIDLNDYMRALCALRDPSDADRRAMVRGAIRLLRVMAQDTYSKIDARALADLWAYAHGDDVSSSRLVEIAEGATRYETQQLAKIAVSALPGMALDSLVTGLRARSPEPTFGEPPYQGRGNAARRGHQWAVSMYDTRSERDGVILSHLTAGA